MIIQITEPGDLASYPYGTSTSKDSTSGLSFRVPEIYKGNGRKAFPGWKGLQAP